jgi:hypothetical protein
MVFWQKQQRVVHHFVRKKSVDFVVFEIGIGLKIDFFWFAAEADFVGIDSFGGKDPVEFVDKTFRGKTVSFEGSHYQADESGFGTAVGAVDQKKAGSSVQNQLGVEKGIKFVLNIFSTDERMPTLVLRIIWNQPVPVLKRGYCSIWLYPD